MSENGQPRLGRLHAVEGSSTGNDGQEPRVTLVYVPERRTFVSCAVATKAEIARAIADGGIVCGPDVVCDLMVTEIASLRISFGCTDEEAIAALQALAAARAKWRPPC